MPDMFDVEPEKKVLCHSRSHLSAPNRQFLGNVLARQNAALIGFLFPAGETHGEYIFKKEKHLF